MHNDPSLAELIAAVRGFIDGLSSQDLTGHTRFNARVASNVLAIALREIEQRPKAERDEIARLADLLGVPEEDKTLPDLNTDLIDKIRKGVLDETNPKLLAHLKATAIAQLNVDQPSYSGLTVNKENDR
ncbi:MAG: DUF6285 domain-containing protein [Hyphomonadaceae bacterium]